MSTGYLSLGRRSGGGWANTWRWTEGFRMPAVSRWPKCPNENQIVIPFPVQRQLFCFVETTEQSGSVSSHCLCCFVSEQLIPVEGNNKCLHEQVKISRWQIFTVINLNTAFPWFWDAIVYTLKSLKSEFVLHLTVSKNPCLKFNMTPHEVSATCTGVKATKYNRDTKYLSSLVQQQNSH